MKDIEDLLRLQAATVEPMKNGDALLNLITGSELDRLAGHSDRCFSIHVPRDKARDLIQRLKRAIGD